MNLDELRGRLFLTVPEAAAEVFGVDERTLRRAITDGQVPGVKVGNKTLIPVPGLLRLLAADHGEDQERQGGQETAGLASVGQEPRHLHGMG